MRGETTRRRAGTDRTGQGAPAGSVATADQRDHQPADRIELTGLRILGTHGVLDEERKRAQPFELDLALMVDFSTAERSDRLADTVDYAAAVDHAVGVVSGDASFSLLEALAGAVADAVLAGDRRIVSVEVALRKVRPPLPVDIASVGVRITRLQ
ncbi:MAG: dihydroneopterin aldolase [Acidimicrobiales bacterium]